MGLTPAGGQLTELSAFAGDSPTLDGIGSFREPSRKIAPGP